MMGYFLKCLFIWTAFLSTFQHSLKGKAGQKSIHINCFSSFLPTALWRHIQQRTSVYVHYIFGKSGFIPCLLPFFSSLLPLQPIPSKPHLPFAAQQPKGNFGDYKFESTSTVNKQKKKRPHRCHVLDKYWDWRRLGFFLGLLFTDCIPGIPRNSFYFFNSGSFDFFFFFKLETFMTFSSLCVATKKYIVLTRDWHDQKQKPTGLPETICFIPFWKTNLSTRYLFFTA